MSVNLTVNGVSYPYPQTGDQNWGTGATGWAQAVTSGMLQKAGGSFSLTALVDFGSNFGIKALYLLSESASSAGTGILRLASTDGINWRNAANSGDISLTTDGSDNLTYNGHILVSSSGSIPAAELPGFTGGDVTSSAGSLVLTIGSSRVTNAMLAGSIAYSKLILTGAILNADLAGSIADTKLSTISTAGKVSDSALPSSMATKTFTGVTSFPGTSNIDGSGNATLGGNLTVNGTVINMTEGASVNWNGTNNLIYGSNSSNYVRIRTNGVDHFFVDSSGNATATGNITSTGKAAITSVTASGASTNGTMTVIDTTAASNTVILNTSGTATFGNIASQTGLFLITDEGNGSSALILAFGSGPTLQVVSQGGSTVFGISAGSANINVYTTANVLTVQNTTGSNKTIKITQIKSG